MKLRALALMLPVLMIALSACGGGGGAPAGGGGNVAKGKTLFESKQCGTCHVLPAVTGAVGTIGPPLNGIGAIAATRKSGMAAEAYLRESLKTPDAFIVPGFAGPPSLMILPVPVNDAEITDLVAFLVAQK